MRVTRNFADLPFAWCATPTQRRSVAARVRDGLRPLRPRAGRNRGTCRWVFPGRALEVGVNADDHILVQSTVPGLSIRRGLAAVAPVLRALERSGPFARSDSWGYLTASIADAGQATRVLFRLRAPSLVAEGYAAEVLARLAAGGLVAAVPAGTSDGWLLTHREPLGTRPPAALAVPARAIAQILALERAVADQTAEVARRGVTR